MTTLAQVLFGLKLLHTTVTSHSSSMVLLVLLILGSISTSQIGHFVESLALQYYAS